MATPRKLTTRELNRATLARQGLLARQAVTPAAMIEHLVGIHAQIPNSPYIGLWTRLQPFERDDLAGLIEGREVVKAAMMRGTLHLFTAEDYRRVRGTIQFSLDQSFATITKGRGAFDVAAIVAEARQFIGDEPRTFAEITSHFEALMPDTDIGAIRHTIRTQIPLVQVANGSTWSYPGNPKFALAEQWLKRPIPLGEANLRELFTRYLRAFGPAMLADMQQWSAMTKLKEVIAPFKADLVTYKDEAGKEYLDVPDMPLPDGETPAPVRFLPELDNLLVCHPARIGVVSAAYRARIYPKNGRLAATIMTDGLVRGVWRIEKTKKAVKLMIEPFEAISPDEQHALHVEGERLIRFIGATEGVGDENAVVEWVKASER